jgi:putative glycosyl hydrolase-like family 6 (GHL6) protein
MTQFDRRQFLHAASAALSGPVLLARPGAATPPWYRSTLRWGQTNINEFDPKRYDIDWWRAHWKRTGTQGVVINAAGIVAYYPSRFKLQYRAETLDGRDLYGELTRAAHEDGLVVFARMDSNRVTEEFFRTNPDWIARKRDSTPYRAADRYITCIDGPYYEEYLPEIFREIIEWERPEGFTDNSWSGLDRDEICYCRHSREKFKQATGRDLPEGKNWADPVYREWIEWSYSRRVALWDLNNRVTKEAGGDDCLWVGMIGGDFVNQGQRFRDVKTICEHSEMIMLDDQSRSEWAGIHENAEMGKRLHGLLGWEKIIPESMATYQRSPVFRKSAATPAESRLWMYSGFAGGIQPWWHHVGAFQWDRRQFKTPIPVYDWYAKNERYLVNRRPVATVGIVYSQRNADFYGQDDAHELVAHPYYGWIQALVRARIPYIPVHADQIDRDAANLSALILPNLAAMTDAQVAAVKRYGARGGNAIGSGETSLYNKWGDHRGGFALQEFFGVKATGRKFGSLGEADSWSGSDHTYLRLRPSVGSGVYGPRPASDDPLLQPGGRRDEILDGFEDTDILPFGGLLTEVYLTNGEAAPVTFLPHFPAYPPETSFMRTPATNVPAIVTRLHRNARRVWLAADVDRRFSRDNLPDHGDLLANIVRWAAKGRIPLEVEGPGLIDCHLYEQSGSYILHLVNVTSAGTWRSPVHEFIPVGPVQVKVRVPEGVNIKSGRLLVAERDVTTGQRNRWVSFEVPTVEAHEVVVIG